MKTRLGDSIHNSLLWPTWPALKDSLKSNGYYDVQMMSI